MNQDRESTFGRQLMSNIQAKLPYIGRPSYINDIDQLNPKYKHFFQAGTKKTEILQKHAISTVQPDDDAPLAGFSMDKKYLEYMYANIDVDKEKRIRDYRVMAAYAEVADALDEICDECIVDDDNGEIIQLTFKNEEKFSTTEREELIKEFDKFQQHFELREKGWEYFRHVLVDGEIFFEHILHDEHVDAGILGIMNVPTELMDPVYDNVQNMIVKGYILRKPVFNPQTGTLEKYEFIPFDKNQMTYVNSGIWNEDKSLRIPFLENARRAYRQLSLMEDAIIIYRLVRAPERLVFNVDVGNMSPPKAEGYLRKLIQQYWSRRTYDSAQANKVQTFNPQSMLDSYWFAKRAGSDGTSVTNLEGGKQLGELDDLLYFMKKLYKALKVPTNRLDPESQISDPGTILREELKFARFIIRLQQNFARGLKDGFVTHLKLKELWKEYDLKEGDLRLIFNEPRNYQQLRTQQIFELTSNNYSAMAQNPEISAIYCQKKYLEWTDKEIKANREFLRKDKELMWELTQIEAGGPNWREAFEAGAAGGEAPAGGPPPMGGGAPMGEPPAFGGPAEVGAGPDIPPPGEATPVEPGAELPPA
jgi:hypothetical protein